MDNASNSTAVQAEPPASVQGGEREAAGSGATTNVVDWRSRCSSDKRQKVIRKIMETLKKVIPVSKSDGLESLESIAWKFEEKVFSAANSEVDYMRKISTKLLNVRKPQNPTVNSERPNADFTHGQQLSPPVVSQSLDRQRLNQNNILSGTANLDNLSSTSSTIRGLTQAATPNVIGQNFNLQNIANISSSAQNSVATSLGKLASDTFGSSPRLIQGRKQQVFTKQQHQQSPNPQQYHYQKLVQHQLIKQNYPQESVPQSPVQAEVQQQLQQDLLLQPSEIQPSQQCKMPLTMQPASLSSLQQTQPSSVQQCTQSMFQQHPQPVRQKLPNLPRPGSISPEQQALIAQQLSLAPKQQQLQQQMIRQQRRRENMHQGSQPNRIPAIQLQQETKEKRNVGQQNNMIDLQRQIGQPRKILDMHQQPVVGTQSCASSLPSNQQPVHLLQKSKEPIHISQQTAINLAPTLPQQSQQQLQLTHQELMSQPGCFQKSTGLQKMISSSNGDPCQIPMDQKIQAESQRLTSEASTDCLAQAGNANDEDWREVIYQKIQAMKEMYSTQLINLYQKIAAKFQQPNALPQHFDKMQLGKLHMCKNKLEQIIRFLRLNKNQIELDHRERCDEHDRWITQFLISRGAINPGSFSQQEHIPQSNLDVMQHTPQPQSQISQMQPFEDQTSSKMPLGNVQGPATSKLENNCANRQCDSSSSAPNISIPLQNMRNTSHSLSSMDPSRGNVQDVLQHVSEIYLHQHAASGYQQRNTNLLVKPSPMNTAESNLDLLRTKSNLMQPQHLNQEEGKMSQEQQVKQQLQRPINQQVLHRPQQQPAQSPTQKKSQLYRITDAWNMRTRHQTSVDVGDSQKHHSSGQGTLYSHQQPKFGSSFPISTQQATSPASSHGRQHTSLQVDQKLPLTNAGSQQSSSLSSTVPSPSTPSAPSPMSVDSNMSNYNVASLTQAGNIGHRSTTLASVSAQPFDTINPRIPASSVLLAVTDSDGTHNVIVSQQPSTVEQPYERLMRMVKSTSSKALSASVSDISVVIGMVDSRVDSAPGRTSDTVIGEDLAATTYHQLQGRKFFPNDESLGSKGIKRWTGATPSSLHSFSGSVNESLGMFNGFEVSDSESTATSSVKRLKVEANHALVREIREINQHLIDTVVDISDEESDTSVVVAAMDCGEGAIVKCSFCPVALSPDLKSHYASTQALPLEPLRLLVPNKYPFCSPILLEEFPVQISKKEHDFSSKAKSRFSISLRSLSQPMSLGDIARTWDTCARAVICEYAQQEGGGSFSSKYGTWDTYLNAA